MGLLLAGAHMTLEEDPEMALDLARKAKREGSRLAVVREAVGLAAYVNGEYAEALRELTAARRISGRNDVLPAIADCERALGRPERAIALAGEGEDLPVDQKAELRIVIAGARRDLGQLDAAIVTLQVPALKVKSQEPWVARLRYAYADALLEAGRREEAIQWFRRAADADADGATDADERWMKLQGVSFDETP